MPQFNLPVTKRYWLSCRDFTICVGVDDNNYITEPAPIVKKFMNQPLENLEKWMKKIGGFDKIELKVIRVVRSAS